MSLNAAQLARRIGKLGASDMNIVMGGDAVKINKLWMEKTGDKLPDDLSEVWEVQRGVMTESGHLDWQARINRVTISRRGDTVDHYRHDWAMCTLDGWLDEMKCPIEVKWTGGNEPWEIIEDRYFPQCQWQMEMTGADRCALSVVLGAARPVMEFIKRDEDYAKQMLARGWTFIQHVRQRTPPVDLPVVPLPVDATRVVDMNGNNEWANQADIWLQLRDSAEAYDDAAKILKSLVPADAKRCFGYGVIISRNRIGNLSLRQMKEE